MRVPYVRITGRKGAVKARVVHPPRVGDHIPLLKFGNREVKPVTPSTGELSNGPKGLPRGLGGAAEAAAG
jgi:hypothetical protein